MQQQLTWEVFRTLMRDLPTAEANVPDLNTGQVLQLRSFCVKQRVPLERFQFPNTVPLQRQVEMRNALRERLRAVIRECDRSLNRDYPTFQYGVDWELRGEFYEQWLRRQQALEALTPQDRLRAKGWRVN